MKAFKKILAVAIAIMMVGAMSLVAFAAEGGETPAATTGTHTISTESTSHTYQIYQIFTGTYDATSGQMQNLKYGSNAVLAEGEKVGDAISQEDATALDTISKKTYADDQEKIDDLLPFVDVTGTPVAEIGKDKAPSASLADGYYIIKDTDNSLTDPETYTLYLFKVLYENFAIVPKSGTVVRVKHVDDQNDSNANDKNELGDSADYDIGDSIPYTLTATLPDNYHDFESYYLEFVDDMSAGLTYNGDAVIYYGAVEGDGTSITFTEDTTATSAYTGGKVYKFAIADLKTTAPSLGDNAVITIKYTATLNSNAVLGSAGNPNEYKIVYNNNPNNSGEGKPTNDTPWDVNIVFTYKTVFNKVDQDTKPLTGADFELYKKTGVNSEGNAVWTKVTELHTGEGALNPTKTGSTAGSTFEFAGLDAGDYKLEETATPNGYNSIDPIEFTITATHDLVSDDPKLTALTGTDGAEFNLTPDLSAGSLTGNIENKQGSVLPSTGGMGTTILYIIGAILVVGACVLLITKKRVAK